MPVFLGGQTESRLHFKLAPNARMIASDFDCHQARYRLMSRQVSPVCKISTTHKRVSFPKDRSFARRAKALIPVPQLNPSSAASFFPTNRRPTEVSVASSLRQKLSLWGPASWQLP